MEVPTPCVVILECDLGNRVFAYIIKLRGISIGSGWTLSPVTGVLIRRGRFGLQHWERNHMKTDTETGPASTLFLDVWPPELWVDTFLLL